MSISVFGKPGGTRSTSYLIGGSDEGNPKAVPVDYLKKNSDSGLIEWSDYVRDVRTYLEKSDVVVLPTYYREGVPRSLIEGASMSKPLISTDMPGCREIVDNNINGYLVPIKDPQALAEAMIKMIEDPELRLAMGKNSRKKVLEEFDEKIVLEKTLKVYKKAGLHYDGN